MEHVGTEHSEETKKRKAQAERASHGPWNGTSFVGPTSEREPDPRICELVAAEPNQLCAEPTAGNLSPTDAQSDREYRLAKLDRRCDELKAQADSNDFSVGEQLVELKAEYHLVYPETRHGGDRSKIRKADLASFVEFIAPKIGRGRTWIYDRMLLTEIPLEWRAQVTACTIKDLLKLATIAKRPKDSAAKADPAEPPESLALLDPLKLLREDDTSEPEPQTPTELGEAPSETAKATWKTSAKAAVIRQQAGAGRGHGGSKAVTAWRNTVLVGDALDQLRNVPDGIVQCCVTSPPYFGMRDYLGHRRWFGGDPACDHSELKEHGPHHPGQVEQTKWKKADAAGKGQTATTQECIRCGAWYGQIGLEPTPGGYVSHLVEIFQEVRRVLRDDGVMFVNLGDSFKDKNLLGIPWRVAHALQEDGWYLRSDIIWSKGRCMPASVRDRPTTSHEHIFLLTKNANYFYDQEAIRETSGGNARTVWNINPRPYPGAHFACFPPDLPTRCIRAGTSETGACPTCGAPWRRILRRSLAPRVEGKRALNERDGGLSQEHGLERTGMSHGKYGENPPETLGWKKTCRCPDAKPVPCVVLDPFAGSGTTLAAAAGLSRDYLGIEVNPEYHKLIQERLRAPLESKEKDFAAWLIRDLRPRRKPVEADHAVQASRVLTVLLEMIEVEDISPRSALDVAVNVGRLLAVAGVAVSSSIGSLHRIYLQALDLLSEGPCDQQDAVLVVQQLRDNIENRSGKS